MNSILANYRTTIAGISAALLALVEVLNLFDSAIDQASGPLSALLIALIGIFARDGNVSTEQSTGKQR